MQTTSYTTRTMSYGNLSRTHQGDQPAGVVPVVMGVFDVNGMSNVNDYFWGKGPVGPDIRDGAITGYWSIKVL